MNLIPTHLVPSRRLRRLITAGIMVGGAVFQPYRPAVVSGNSMNPTYRSGEWVMTTKEVGELKRGDVVIVQTPKNGIMIKRVAFLPGEKFYRITARDGQYNDLITVGLPRHQQRVRGLGQVEVPRSQYYLLGDNLENSVDSREYGFVGRGRILGRVVDPRPIAQVPIGLQAAYGIGDGRART